MKNPDNAILLTPKQAKRVGMGRTIKVLRHGDWLTIGIKNNTIAKLKAKINALQAKIDSIESKRK